MQIADIFTMLRSHLAKVGIEGATLSIDTQGISLEFSEQTFVVREKALGDIFQTDSSDDLMELLDAENDRYMSEVDALEMFVSGNH